MKPFKETALHSDYAWSSIQKSLQNFFSTIQDPYKGRYPNGIHAAQQMNAHCQVFIGLKGGSIEISDVFGW